jgi:hypothetical protein
MLKLLETHLMTSDSSYFSVSVHVAQRFGRVFVSLHVSSGASIMVANGGAGRVWFLR